MRILYASHSRSLFNNMNVIVVFISQHLRYRAHQSRRLHLHIHFLHAVDGKNSIFFTGKEKKLFLVNTNLQCQKSSCCASDSTRWCVRRCECRLRRIRGSHRGSLQFKCTPREIFGPLSSPICLIPLLSDCLSLSFSSVHGLKVFFLAMSHMQQGLLPTLLHRKRNIDDANVERLVDGENENEHFVSFIGALVRFP